MACAPAIPSRPSHSATAPPRSGRACPCWSRCCSVDSPPISSGVWAHVAGLRAGSTPPVVLVRMDLARLQEDSPQIADALLREQHLVVGLNHGSSSSTIPRVRKLLEV